MRILIVCHPPLTVELGAAQVALNLAASLQARGHDVLVWSPEPLSPPARWWDRWRRQRRAIESFVADHGPFDVIDLPAISASPRLAHEGLLVARSVQPDLQYFASTLREEFRRPTLRLPFHALYDGIATVAILQGWRRSPLLLCQGSAERDWMCRRFPRWAPRIRSYVVAPSPAEQQTLATIRAQRSRREVSGSGTRFLWIGRWVPQKGTRTLLRFIAERALSHPADTFTLAGCGNAAEQEAPADLVRDGRARIIPHFHRGELAALLADHDAGLFTSTVEGWGLSLNEMLESGLTVYATPAGAVADLRPFWRGRLRPFPPPPGLLQEGLQPDLEGYYSFFSWPEIARRYEEDVLP